MQILLGKEPDVSEKGYLYHVVSHSTRNGAICAEKLFHRIIFCCLSIFSLLVIHYFNSSIKTSLVVIDEPKIWYSYEDIINAKARPFFMGGTNSEFYFKFARPNSSKARLWQYARKNFEWEQLVINPVTESFSEVGFDLLMRKAAFITESLYMKTIQKTGCKVKSVNIEYAIKSQVEHLKLDKYDINDLIHRSKKFLFYASSDPSEGIIQKGVVMSEYFTSRAGVIFRKFLRYTIENGIHFSRVKLIESKDILNENFQKIFYLKRTDPGILDEVRACSSDFMSRAEPPLVDNIEVKNMTKLIYVSFILLIVCFATLALEKFIRDFLKKKARASQVGQFVFISHLKFNFSQN